jgi:hypothetical protein
MKEKTSYNLDNFSSDTILTPGALIIESSEHLPGCNWLP